MFTRIDKKPKSYVDIMLSRNNSQDIQLLLERWKSYKLVGLGVPLHQMKGCLVKDIKQVMLSDQKLVTYITQMEEYLKEYYNNRGFDEDYFDSQPEKITQPMIRMTSLDLGYNMRQQQNELGSMFKLYILNLKTGRKGEDMGYNIRELMPHECLQQILIQNQDFIKMKI